MPKNSYTVAPLLAIVPILIASTVLPASYNSICVVSGPKTQWVACPYCDAETVAVLPPDSDIVEDAERADGKVWVNCWDCSERFLVRYRTGTDAH